MAAASKLSQSGFLNVTILEASNRIGGRVRSSLEFGKNHGYVELGAQWIHGEIGNVAFKVCTKCFRFLGREMNNQTVNSIPQLYSIWQLFSLKMTQ